MTAPLSPSEQRRAVQLAAAKRRATGLLVAVTVVFLVSTLLLRHASWLVWVQVTAVASMVGALADWFAVTALFRRPLGLPIPHTAIVVERKDRFAETLGAFVQESFLTPEAVSERLRAAQAVPRAAAWLADPVHAGDVSARLAEALVAGADLLRDEDVHQILVTAGRQRLDRIALAPLAGRLLQELTQDRRHDPIVDTALAGLSRYLEHHGPELHARLGKQSPWWLPGPVEDLMVERLLLQSRRVLADMAADRDHPLRQQLDASLAKLAIDLQTSDDMRRRGEALKADVLGQSQLRQFAAELWRDTKAQLRAQAAQPGSALRVRMAAMVGAAGARLRDDPEMAAAAERSLDSIARVVLGRFDKELARLVSGTISRWDATETSRRLELLLGPDLQYIRINGTVVGAGAGLALHAVSRLIG
jgi:uncharacterized membrane-anchored protein YjiN (DUF445 family)